MLTLNELINKWNSLDVGREAFTRIDADHQLDFYVGKDVSGLRLLLLLSDKEPSGVIGSRSVAVDVGKRHDGRWSIGFKLLKKEHEQVFLNLCFDLIESSRTETANGVSFVMRRFMKWQQLMQQLGGGLSLESEKGLFGELLFLETCIVSGHNLLSAIEGWVGCEKADRDFVFNDKWFEIKSVSPSAISVSISSIEQLDIEDFGELVINFVETTTADDEKGVTLKELVDRIRKILELNIEAVSKFNTKLLSAGYTDAKQYDENHYVCRAVKRYQVDGTFPRLRKSDLPFAIVRMSYELAISALHSWKLE